MTDDGIDAPSVPAGDFARDTEVTAVAGQPGRFTAHLPDAWKVFFAFGGATMATALRAAQTAIDRPDLGPLFATATFAAPVSCGDLTIDTRVLRSGRSATQVTADLRTGPPDERDGETDIHLVAVFGAPHESTVDYVDVDYPADAVDVEHAEPPPPPPEGSPFASINYHHQTEFLAGAAGGFMAGDWDPGGPARSLSWHRLLKEPRLPDGTIDPIAYCVPADMLGSAIFAKLGPIGPDNPPFLMLSLEITVQFIAPTTSAWLLQHTRAPQVGQGYAYGSVELWDTDRRLVAIASQRAHIRPVDISRFAPEGTA